MIYPFTSLLLVLFNSCALNL